MEGATECIQKVYEDGRVVASMGHTGASFEEANVGIEAGVRHATHLFNAMTALQHRNPGVVGAALSDERVSCELIADTFHVNPGLYRLVAKAKEDKLCLITDCMRAGGMEDGDYTLGGQHVIKTGIQCLLEDGTIAGSVLKLNEAVKNLREHTDMSRAQVFACASLNPAKVVGESERIGSLEVGKCADIIMNNTALVQVKVDAETKTDVTRIYESLGLDLPTAVRIFFKKSIAVGGLPFELRNDTSSERWNIYKEARNSIKNNNIPEMSLDEINAEISAARAAR